jgi:hypothetical protein
MSSASPTSSASSASPAPPPSFSKRKIASLVGGTAVVTGVAVYVASTLLSKDGEQQPGYVPGASAPAPKLGITTDGRVLIGDGNASVNSMVPYSGGHFPADDVNKPGFGYIVNPDGSYTPAMAGEVEIPVWREKDPSGVGKDIQKMRRQVKAMRRQLNDISAKVR